MAGAAVAFVTVGPRASRIWIYLVHGGGRQLHAAVAELMMSMRAAHSGHIITRKGGNHCSAVAEESVQKKAAKTNSTPYLTASRGQAIYLKPEAVKRVKKNSVVFK